jgi:hypothetical protein
LYFMKGQGTLSTLVYYASLIALWIALTWHPLLKDDSDTFLQEIIPIHVAIRRLVNPLKMKMKANDYFEHDSNKYNFEYIRENILAYSDQNAENMQKAYDPLTPFHRSMILMGCYGDMTAKNPENSKLNLIYPLIWQSRDGDNIPFDFSKIGSQSDFMAKSKRTKDNAFMTNLMLQALEDKNDYVGMSRGVFGSMRDRSICDCMRDFAAPSMMEVGADTTTCEGTSQNSCGVQNILDYTMNGELTEATNGQLTQLRDMSPISQTRSQTRNRPDPLRVQFEAFFTSQHGASPGATDVLATNVPLFHFLKLYCGVQGYQNTVHPEGTSAQGELKNRYDAQQRRKCPVSAKDYLDGKAGATTLKVVEARTMVHKFIENAHAHNKLQTPYVLDKGVFRASNMPPDISYKSYNHYISKYQAAFETCDQIAVPNYVTRISAYTNSVNWQVLGHAMLLLAAAVAFWWAYIIKFVALDDERKTQRGEKEKQACCEGGNEMLSQVMSYVNIAFMLVACGISFWFMAQTVNVDFSESRIESDDNASLFVIFAALFWILFLVMLVIVVAMIFYILHAMYKGMIEKATHYDFLIKLVFGAQIAMDVPVILGLTFVAVGSSLQRGVGDFYLLATIMIFFILIGFTTHITNVLRILDLIAQSNGTKDEHASKIKYNRVAIGVIISLMLFLSLYLAGLDSYQGESYGVWYYTIFVFVAILILCVSDLTLEFLCLFKVQEFTSKDELVFSFVHQKAKNLAWIIICGVFVMIFYTYITICQRSEPVFDRADVCKYVMGWGST